MAEKIATRAAYGEALVALAEEYPELVVLDADLSGSTMTKGFAKAHPDRFYNMGIAEANMTGVAAGLAACGKKPFTNTFAMFAAGRAWEQVRNSIAYPRLNVKVVGSHGGLSVGEDGATHQCIEDYAIMRAIPNMMVVSPCDGPEMRQAVRALLDRGTDVAMPVLVALKAAESLAAEGLSVRVLDMHTIKPLDGELVLKAALETGAIVTTEEANVVGGLGSAVAEFLAEHHPVPVVRHGVNDVFGRSGKAEAVLEAYGLTPEGIAEKVRHAVKRKK